MSVSLRPSLRWHLECEKLVPPREVFVEPLDAIPETDARNQQNKQVVRKKDGLGFLRVKPISSRHTRYLLIKLKGTFFYMAVGPRPNFAHMCALRREWLSPKIFFTHPPHSNRNPFLLKAVRPAAGRPLWTNHLCVASLFGEMLLYQHQRIVTMTKV